MNLMLVAAVLSIAMIACRVALAQVLQHQSAVLKVDAAFCVGILGAAIAAGVWARSGATVADGLMLLVVLPVGWFVGTFAIHRLEIEPPLLREWAEGTMGDMGKEQLR